MKKSISNFSLFTLASIVSIGAFTSPCMAAAGQIVVAHAGRCSAQEILSLAQSAMMVSQNSHFTLQNMPAGWSLCFGPSVTTRGTQDLYSLQMCAGDLDVPVYLWSEEAGQCVLSTGGIYIDWKNQDDG